MKSFIRLFIKYPIWSNAFIFLTIVVGLFSFANIKRSFFPETPQRNIQITVVMPGASPEEMDEGVTTKIEESIKGIQGIERYTSTTRENSSAITVEVKQNYDIDKALTDVKNAVDGISGFPVEAEEPIVFVPKNVGLAMRMVLKGDVPLQTLKTMAEDIEDEFLAKDFISQVEITGLPALEISVEVSEANLLRYNLTFDEISNAISTNNRDISGGSLKSDEEEIVIRSNAKRFEPEEIEAIVIRSNDDGSILRVGDIATVTQQFADVPNKTLFNGKNAITIAVNKLPEEDVVLITDYLEEYVEEFNASRQNVGLYITNDQSVPLFQRITLLRNNGAIGLLLVLIALGLFLSLRVSFWVAVGIPLSFLGMFFIANLAGITINMISLFGMILVIGILVDDGIVIAENIFVHAERGKSPIRAAIDGATEVIPSVFVAVTTTMLAFSVLFFLEGRVGDIVKEMAIVVIACLSYSLLEATIVLPPHLALSGGLGKKKKQSGFRKRINDFIDFFRVRVYGPMLRFSLNYSPIAIAILLFSIFTIQGMRQADIIPSTFFPPISRDEITLSMALQPGTTENVTEEKLREIEEVIWVANDSLKAQREDGLDIVISTKIDIGSGGGESGGHAGTIEIELLDGETRQMESSAIANVIRGLLGPVEGARKLTIGSGGAFGKPVAVNLMSKNSEELLAAKDMLKGLLNEQEELRDVTDNDVVGAREIQIELKPTAYILGLTHSDISRQIRQGFFGQEVQRLQKGTDEIRVWVRYPEADRFDIGKLEQMRIKAPNGVSYPLTELVDYTIGRSVVAINHFNGARQIYVEADMANQGDPVGPVMERVQNEIIPQVLARYPSVVVTYEGQAEQSRRFTGSLMNVLPVVAVLIFLLIMLVFRSPTQAFFIILLIPIGVFFAQLGHWFHGKPTSILSMYGYIALGGILINDAVVFMNKYNQLLTEGMKFKDALYEAGQARFRAIVLTSITTVAGLYPLILGKSLQAQFLIPMAISVVYGVLFGTFIILTALPAFIHLFNYVRRAFKWTKILLVEERYYWPTAEEVEPAYREHKRLTEKNFND